MKRVQIYFVGVAVFFSGIFGNVSLADAGSDFVLLKNIATQELRLSHLGRINHDVLLFKAFEYEQSVLLHLGVINQHALLEELNNAYNTDEESTKNIKNIQFFAHIDIWDYLDQFSDRNKGIDEYLFLAKSSEKKSIQRQVFLEQYLSSLEERISEQQDEVKVQEEEFSGLLPAGKSESIELAKNNLVTQTAIFTRMKAEYAQKKYEYKTLSSSLSALSQKIIAIEENRTALVFNVKTPENSGKFIGVITQ